MKQEILTVTHISLVKFTGKSDLYGHFKDSADCHDRTGQLESFAGMPGSIWHMKMDNAKVTVTSDFILGHEAMVRFEGPEENGFVRGTINFGFNQKVLAISCYPDREGGLHGGCSVKLYTTKKSTKAWLKGEPLD